MKFRQMRIRNFLSFGEDEQFISFVDNDIILILGQNLQEGGSNGAGKTTIFNAIVWAIYGRTTKGLAADEVVNNTSGGNCMVDLEFTIGPKHVQITRWRKIGGKRLKNKLILKVDGNDKSLANMNDTQDRVNDLIKINFRSFISSVMFSQDRIFSFTDASTAKRKEIVENVLQVDNLSVYEKLLKNEQTNAQSEYDEYYHDQKGKRELAENLTQTVQDYFTSCKIKFKKLSHDITGIKKELDKLQKVDIDSEKEKHRKNDSSKKRKDKLVKARDELRIKEDNEAEKIGPQKKQIKEKNNALKRDSEAVDKANEEMITAKENPNTCPICGNVVNREAMDKYINERRELVDRMKKEIDRLDSGLTTLEEELEAASKYGAQYEEDADKLDVKISSIKFFKSKITLGELEHVKEQIGELAGQTRTLTEQRQNIVDMDYTDSIKTQIKTAKKIVRNLQKELDNLQDDIKHINFWIHAFSKGENTVRSFLINKVIDFINSRINHYLSVFFNEEIDFSLNREMDHRIFKNGHNVSLAQLSGGEEQRVNLAIAFSLFDLVKVNLGNDINMIFMDEVLDRNLDENGITALLKIIDDLKERGNSVYVISHKDNFKAYFNNSMMIYKDEQGVSKILAA